MKYRIWYSTESFADYIIAKTDLRSKTCIKKRMYESDANNARNFHTMPDHIKQILYLDAPDIIVEIDTEPIFSIEVSTEAGTGHNVFQRFARLAASVENNVPSFYIYPEAVIIHRTKGKIQTTKWDEINPLIFKALEHVMTIYNIPSLFYYFPSDFRTQSDPKTSTHLKNKGLIFDSNKAFAGSPDSNDADMREMFKCINEIIGIYEKHGVIDGRGKLLANRTVIDRKDYMQDEFANKKEDSDMSPLTATFQVPTKYLLNYLKQFENSGYKIGELLRSRDQSILYQVDSKTFRADPYAGCIAAIDYLKCREGKTFEERKFNLIVIWGELHVDHDNETISISSQKLSSINSLISSVKNSEYRNLLKRNYTQLKNYEIPRYFMQMRYGSTFSKPKEVRIFAYFADAILFQDGALWRDG